MNVIDDNQEQRSSKEKAVVNACINEKYVEVWPILGIL